jgi:hypothetical protein
MTVDEFNEKYKDFLEEGHYGLAIDYPTVIEYLDKCFEKFVQIPGFQYSQIKLKFNMCRFYSTLDNATCNEIEEHINMLVKAQETKTQTTS